MNGMEGRNVLCRDHTSFLVQGSVWKVENNNVAFNTIILAVLQYPRIGARLLRKVNEMRRGESVVP
jgi:hypothetical protein